MKEENFNNEVKFQAVRKGIFTAFEFPILIQHLETNLEELFWAFNNLEGIELKKRLRLAKLEYESRFLELPIEVQSRFRHIYNKLVIFLEEEIEKLLNVQSKNIDPILLDVESDLKEESISIDPAKIIQKEEIIIEPQENEIEVLEEDQSSITHYEVLLALHYIVFMSNSSIDLDKTKIVELLYYLQRRNPKTTFVNTAEYRQIKFLFQNDATKKRQLLKVYGLKASVFLKSIGLLSVANLIEMDMKE